MFKALVISIYVQVLIDEVAGQAMNAPDKAGSFELKNGRIRLVVKRGTAEVNDGADNAV